MFLGTHAPRLDDKGRLVLPAKFREQLAAGLVPDQGSGPIDRRVAGRGVLRLVRAPERGVAVRRSCSGLLEGAVFRRLR